MFTIIIYSYVLVNYRKGVIMKKINTCSSCDKLFNDTLDQHKELCFECFEKIFQDEIYNNTQHIPIQDYIPELDEISYNRNNSYNRNKGGDE